MSADPRGLGAAIARRHLRFVAGGPILARAAHLAAFGEGRGALASAVWRRWSRSDAETAPEVWPSEPPAARSWIPVAEDHGPARADDVVTPSPSTAAAAATTSRAAGVARVAWGDASPYAERSPAPRASAGGAVESPSSHVGVHATTSGAPHGVAHPGVASRAPVPAPSASIEHPATDVRLAGAVPSLVRPRRLPGAMPVVHRHVHRDATPVAAPPAPRPMASSSAPGPGTSDAGVANLAREGAAVAVRVARAVAPPLVRRVESPAAGAVASAADPSGAPGGHRVANAATASAPARRDPAPRRVGVRVASSLARSVRTPHAVAAVDEVRPVSGARRPSAEPWLTAPAASPIASVARAAAAPADGASPPLPTGDATARAGPEPVRREPAVDLDDIVERVVRRLSWQVTLEAERRGVSSWRSRS